MRGGIEFDLNNAVDEAVTTALNPFSDALNNGIESVGEGFFTAVNTVTPDVIRNTETFGTLFGIQKTNIDTLDWRYKRVVCIFVINKRTGVYNVTVKPYRVF